MRRHCGWAGVALGSRRIAGYHRLAHLLQAADVGLAMGKSGTQVAQAASDIVILDDRFSSIVKVRGVAPLCRRL